MTMRSTKIYESTEIVVNENGEILESKSRVKRKVTSAEFMQVYLEDHSGLMKISSGNEIKVLVTLWSLSQFDTNQVILIKPIKEQIAQKIGISYNTLRNIISELSKKNLLVKKDRSMYYLNPKYFFKGYVENRPKVIKMVLEYQISDETEKAEKGT